MHPDFALASAKMGEIEKEYDRFLEVYETLVVPLKADPTPIKEWGWVSMTSTGIEHVYTGIEGVLKTLVTLFDGYVHGPKDEYHKNLLAQALIETPDRSAILDGETYDQLNELRGFRHAERNNYVHALRAPEVQDNFERLKSALPLFKRDINDFIDAMSRRLYAAEEDQYEGRGDPKI